MLELFFFLRKMKHGAHLFLIHLQKGPAESQVWMRPSTIGRLKNMSEGIIQMKV